MTRIKQMGTRREVTCPDCGSKREVGFYYELKSEMLCKACTARRGGSAPKPNRKTGVFLNCIQCGEEFYRRPSDGNKRFCSSKCFDASRRTNQRTIRRCTTCSIDFEYIEKPHSNSSGKYCSQECRDSDYVNWFQGKPAKGAFRSRWHTIRRRHLETGDIHCRLQDDCKGRLEVHHIEPLRSGENNSPTNLMTVCHSCHVKMEKISDMIARQSAIDRALAVEIVQQIFPLQIASDRQAV